MSRRRKKNKRVNDHWSKAHPSIPAPNSDTPPCAVVDVHQEIKTFSSFTDTCKLTVEKAADRLRSRLVSEGRLQPMAFFLNADGSMKTVSLLVKNEYQKEALLRRIQEKVSAENISTVIILTETDHEHTAILSVVSPGMRCFANVDYSFDSATKTVTSWQITWLNESVQNVFLDSIFDYSS